MSRRRGLVHLTLEPVEREVLADLLDQLTEALGELAPDDPVRQRLYPAGHRDDAQIAAEYRELTEEGLTQQRRARIAQCRADVESATPLVLDADQVRRWLQTLNDLRLAIGTRLGVTEENSTHDHTGPEARSWAIYHWLSGLQDALVNAAAR